MTHGASPARHPGFVRTATADDLPAIADIYNEAVLHTVATFDVEPQPPELFADRVASTRPGDHVVVAEGGAGSSGWRTPRPTAAPGLRRHPRDVGLPRPRGPRSRPGLALYDELLARVDADGIHVCLAVIAQPNPASEALHAAVGFEGSARCARWAASSTGGSTPPGGSGCARSDGPATISSDPSNAVRPRRYAAHMGATGSGPFENDDALDFLDTLADLPAGRPRPPGARGARRGAARPGYVEAPLMCEAVAGAAAVGASVEPRGRGGQALPARLAGRPSRCRPATRSSSRSRARCSAARCARTTTSGGSSGTRQASRTTSRHPAVARCGWLGDRDD